MWLKQSGVARSDESEKNERWTPESNALLPVGCAFDRDLGDLARRNDYFRRVLYTTPDLQLMLMYLKPGEDIGIERHAQSQFMQVVRGGGYASVGRSLRRMAEGVAVIVPPGAEHNVRADHNGEGLWLTVIYSPPAHRKDLEERVKR